MQQTGPQPVAFVQDCYSQPPAYSTAPAATALNVATTTFSAATLSTTFPATTAPTTVPGASPPYYFFRTLAEPTSASVPALVLAPAPAAVVARVDAKLERNAHLIRNPNEYQVEE